MLEDYSDINKIKKILLNNHNNIHLWIPIKANCDYVNYKINFINCINKYIKIKNNIDNNFYIDIKSNNEVSILINDTFEILLGVWNNTKSILRYYDNNKIISSYEKETLNKSKFIRFNFDITNKIIVKKENDIMFVIDNDNIKNIKIKNNSYSGIYIDYESLNYLSDKIKIHLFNNYNIKLFYTENYLENYIEKINLLDLLDF